MKVHLSQLVLEPTIRLRPEDGIEILIGSIRQNGLLYPIRVSVIPWDCWCEEGHVFHANADGICPKCGVVQTVTFKVLDGYRRVKALQFLGIAEAEIMLK